jgi:hypothetical protein
MENHVIIPKYPFFMGIPAVSLNKAHSRRSFLKSAACVYSVLNLLTQGKP